LVLHDQFAAAATAFYKLLSLIFRKEWHELDQPPSQQLWQEFGD
jgi:hypothetical protein